MSDTPRLRPAMDLAGKVFMPSTVTVEYDEGDATHGLDAERCRRLAIGDGDGEGYCGCVALDVMQPGGPAGDSEGTDSISRYLCTRPCLELRNCSESSKELTDGVPSDKVNENSDRVTEPRRVLGVIRYPCADGVAKGEI